MSAASPVASSMDVARAEEEGHRSVMQADGFGKSEGTEDVELHCHDVGYPWIIVTPSLSTGFDLPYRVGWQAVAKVPFADLGDSLVKARRDFELPADPRFGKRSYDDDAINQIIQASGRAVRAPDDSGVTYILDGHFWGLYKRAFSPGYFKEAITWVN